MRTWMLAAAGTVLAAAGAGAAPVATTGTTAFTVPVVVTGEDLSEPGVDVAPDGTLYVNAIRGPAVTAGPSATPLYRSSNGGTTWQQLPLGARGTFPGGAAFDLTIDPGSGALATTDLWAANSTVARSAAGGGTWEAQPLQGEPLQGRPWVEAVGGGIVYHAAQVAAGLVVTTSGDGGLTYGRRALVVPATEGCHCPSGNLIAERASGGGDRVGLVYATGTGVGFARTLNGSLTWQRTVVDANGGGDTLAGVPVVATAGNGVLAAAWMEVTATASRTAFSVSSDWGTTWSAPRHVVAAGTSAYPWVAARGSKIGISLYHTSAAGTPDTVPGTAAWYEKYLESLDGGATWSAPQTADATPVKTGPICTGGINCSEDRELGGFQMLAFDPAARPNLAYVRSIDGLGNVEVRYVRGA